MHVDDYGSGQPVHDDVGSSALGWWDCHSRRHVSKRRRVVEPRVWSWRRCSRPRASRRRRALAGTPRSRGRSTAARRYVARLRPDLDPPADPASTRRRTAGQEVMRPWPASVGFPDVAMSRCARRSPAASCWTRHAGGEGRRTARARASCVRLPEARGPAQGYRRWTSMPRMPAGHAGSAGSR